MGEKGRNQAHAQLQPGLCGNYFSKLFGTQQSFLESLLLKRRIEGPSWIGLKQPVRVDDSRKASFINSIHFVALVSLSTPGNS